MARRDQHLYRDEDDKMLGGVCAGLARYFDVDTALMRVVFVALGLVGGGAAIAYIVLWVVMDPAPAGYWNEESAPPAPPTVTATPDSGVIDLENPEPEPQPAEPTQDPENTMVQDPTQP